MRARRRSVVGVLAGIEGRRLLRHPAASLALLSPILMLAAAAAPDEDFLAYKLLVGAGFLPAATAGLLASWAAMSRSRRDSTDELFASTPVTPTSRARAHLLAVAAPTAAAALLLAVAVVALMAWRGLPTPVLPAGLRASGVEELTPAWSGLIQGPALVAAAGAVGLAIGRSAAPAAAVLVAAVAALYLTLVAMLWWRWGWERFLLPAAHDLDAATTVEVGDRSVLVVTGHVPDALAWHLVYLAGIAGTAAALALTAGSRRRLVALSLLCGFVVTAVGLAGQRLAWTTA